MNPGQGMMACFSLSGPNVLFYVENMGRDPVPLAIIFLLLWGEERKLWVDILPLGENELFSPIWYAQFSDMH